MYAQHRSTANIPKNYSGNAFRYPPIEALTDQDGRQTETVPPSPADPPREQAQPSTLPEQTLSAPSPAHRTPDDVPYGGGHELLRGITQAFGNEELLLIGLFLLLSGHKEEHDGQRSDLLFYLLLLFFCG